MPRSFDDLFDDRLCLVWIFFQPLGYLFLNKGLYDRTNLGRYQLVLGLTGEFRVGNHDRKRTGQSFPGILSGQVDLCFFCHPGVRSIRVDRAGKRRLEPLYMGSSVHLRDVVREGEQDFVVAVGPPHSQLHPDGLPFSNNMNWFTEQAGLRAVQETDILAQSSLEMKSVRLGIRRPFVPERNPHTGIEKSQLPQAILERVIMEPSVSKGLHRCEESDACPGPSTGIANLADFVDGLTVFETGDVLSAVTPDLEFKPFGKCVDNRDTDSMESARNLVSVRSELAAGVERGHDHLGGGSTFLLEDTNWNSTTVVDNGDTVVGMKRHRYAVSKARHDLVDTVVDDLIDHVVETGPVVRVANVHSRSPPDRLQTFQYLDVVDTVFVRSNGILAHIDHLPD